ncbi:MAG TPA: hypothetical protein DDW65_12700, partial [Firmicutes bacterium]|nr:hypothetical protein [Bacillota bacterium]
MNKVKPFFISGIIFVALTYSVVAIRAEHSTTDDLEQAKALYYQNIESGRQEFSRIVNSDPQNEIARLNLIRILRETGQYQTAINQLKILLQQNPNEQNYRSALIECTYMAGAFFQTLRISYGKNLTSNEIQWQALG